MRLFLAIALTSEISGGVATLQERLRAAVGGADVRWAATENLHLTVLFLGEMTDDRLPALREACATIAQETADFRIRVAGLSGFPKATPGRPAKPLKTLWAGVTDGAASWRELVARAEPWFTPLGVAKNGGLVPHITVGRVGAKATEADEALLREALTALAAEPVGEQWAKELCLVQSILTPEGAHYSEQGRWPFPVGAS